MRIFQDVEIKRTKIYKTKSYYINIYIYIYIYIYKSYYIIYLAINSDNISPWTAFQTNKAFWNKLVSTKSYRCFAGFNFTVMALQNSYRLERTF